MKIKTSNLTGSALDWTVLSIEYPAWDSNHRINHALGNYGWCAEPSVDWSEGGPIIERERISTKPYTLGTDWFATVPSNTGGHLQNGPTPLIAAMRCFVAFRFGDEVDIPDELL